MLQRLALLLLTSSCLGFVKPLAGSVLAAATGSQQPHGGAHALADLRCFTRAQRADINYVEGVGGEVVSYNDTQVCRFPRANGTDSDHDRLISCYAIWTEEETNEGRKVEVKSQGCYFGSIGEKSLCTGDRCVESGTTRMNNTYYCCCATPLCNGEGNLAHPPPSSSPHSLGPQDSAAVDALSSSSDIRILVAVGSTLIGCCLLVLVLYFIYRKKALQYAPKRLLMAAAEAASGGGASRASSGPASRLLSPVSAAGGGGLATSSCGLSMGVGLKMDSLLHRGKFGEVWHATLDGHGSVCVKLFNSSQSQHALFLNERDIYSLPLIEHEAVVRCLAAEERRSGGATLSAQYVIVMEYHPMGSLNSYLKGAKGGVNYQTFCAMCHSIAAGLGHLHLEILGSTLGGPSGGPHKPAIVHRDLNSRNILVKNDLTCAIADMGFALKIKGSKYCRNEEENVEEASLRDVGTVRYMAPEILDGAVNLRECEASLKQIDVYALGLVLWEIATQCCDMYQGNRTSQPYRIPYEDEVGLNPTFEDMQSLVSKNRRRPNFPTTWKDTPVVHSIKETIQDCWDYDAEARLTALCVQERFKEFSAVSEVRNRPTSVIALNQNVDGSKPRAPPCGLLVGSAQLPRGEAVADRDDKETSPLLGSSLAQGSNIPLAAPSTAGESNAKTDVNVELDQNRRQQQTIAGRNSLISRNTMQPYGDDVLDVVGNTLVKRAPPLACRTAQPSGATSSGHSCPAGSNAASEPLRGTGSFCGRAAGAHHMAPTTGQSQRGSAADGEAADSAVDALNRRRLPSDAAAASSARHSTTGLQKKVHNCASESIGSVAAVGLDLVSSSSQSQQTTPAAAADNSDAAAPSVGGVRTQSRSARPDSLALRMCTK